MMKYFLLFISVFATSLVFGEERIESVNFKLTMTKLDELSQPRIWKAIGIADGYTYTNSYKRDVELALSGGGKNNACDIKLYVNNKLTAYHTDNNRNWSKTCVVSAIIPVGAAWKVLSRPYGGGVGSVSGSILTP